ncbi:MAG: hypothetical protein G01um10147_852 [Microgenomates group bacterium Gr01-1014_7]|nr:MAG: hypothetical protein G01um10147_852 [Microgenomates group bacterium Gr01-1014_7]
MTTRSLTPVGKFFLKITEWVGTPISAIIHTLLFGGIFLLKLVGFSTEFVLAVLTTTVALEVIYLAIFIQLSINKSARTLEKMEEEVAAIREDEVKTHTILIHLGHQMKAIQQDLDILKKNGFLKSSNGNGKHPIRRAHA